SRIRKASEEADVIVISHYHYDHFTDFDEELYEGKLILAKSCNEYINDSQRKRAEKFYNRLCGTFGNVKLNDLLEENREKKYPDPLTFLPQARSKDYGDYSERKRELLKKGKKWFHKRVENWNKFKLIPEVKFDKCQVRWADEREFRFGKTRVRFTRPLFHGIEYARVGWVISTIITLEDEKIIHSSDLQGPVIEDHSEWIIKENPNLLIVDGPSTYLIPFMLNLINLRRAVENMCRIIKETDSELVVYDHHLLRERLFRKRVKGVYQVAEEENKKVLTAAEYLGKTPVVLEKK
ncbi:MBL fold metallo-hydrolase, partial [Candidatus Bathyarchaeota archaeon]|nr:MBL fold metallo-hydrolase [Candidatus Bathyarchaeota archaeon]